MKTLEIGDEVARIDGGYTVGRKGTIIEIKDNRARVAWNNNPRTWVSFNSIELTSVPYKIVQRLVTHGIRKGRTSNTYVRI